MLSLPISSSPLRELFCCADLATIGTVEGRAKIATFRDAMNGAKSAFADAAVKSVNAVCLRATGEVWLIEIRRSGSWKRLWNFGAA